MILDKTKPKRAISFKLGTLILFLLLGVALIIGLGFMMIGFAAQAAPVGDPIFNAIWRTADFIIFQALSIGIICFLVGGVSKIPQLNFPLSNVIAVSITFSIVLYAIWIIQGSNDGIIIRVFS